MANKGSSLATGAYLATNDYLVSANGLYFVIMQGDGNLVEYVGGRALWRSGTAGNIGAWAVVQGDGNHGQSLETPPDACVQGYLNSYLASGAVPGKPGLVNATCEIGRAHV